jgi:hypothetical protein
MKLADIVTILKNRLISLTENRKLAVASGDLENVNEIDKDILSTTTSLEQLQAININ